MEASSIVEEDTNYIANMVTAEFCYERFSQILARFTYRPPYPFFNPIHSERLLSETYHLPAEDMVWASCCLKQELHGHSRSAKPLTKSDDSKTRDQQTFIAVTTLLTDSRTPIDSLSRVESLLMLGSHWQHIFDPSVRKRQEEIRIELAISAFEAKHNCLFWLYAKFLLPQHLSVLVTELSDRCQIDQVWLLLELGADPKIIEPYLGRAELISSDMCDMLQFKTVWEDVGRCRRAPVTSKLSSSSPTTKVDLSCVLCKAFRGRQGLTESLVCELFERALKSSCWMSTLLEVLYHTWKLLNGSFTLTEFFFQEGRSARHDLDDNSLLEAMICLDLGDLGPPNCADLSQEAVTLKSRSKNSQLVTPLPRRKLNLVSLTQSALQNYKVGMLEVLRRYSSHYSEEMLWPLRCKISGLSIDLPYPHGILTHEVYRLFRRNSRTRYKYHPMRISLLRQLIASGIRCVGFVDEIYSALLYRDFETAFLLIRSLYTQPSYIAGIAPSKERTWKVYNPECSNSNCPAPRLAEQLGWSDLALPVSLEAAIISILRASWTLDRYDYEHYFSCPCPHPSPHRFISLSASPAILEDFMRGSSELDQHLEFYFNQLCTAGSFGRILYVESHYPKIPLEALFRYLIASVKGFHVFRGNLLSLEQRQNFYSEIKTVVLERLVSLPSREKCASFKLLGKLTQWILEPCDRLPLVQWIAQQNFETEDSQAFLHGCFIEPRLEISSTRLIEQRAKMFRESGFDVDAVVLQELDSYIKLNTDIDEQRVRYFLHLLSGEATDWILQLPEAHNLATESLLKLIFEKSGRIQISEIKADKLLKRIVEDGFILTDFSSTIVSQASAAVKQDLLFKASTLMLLDSQKSPVNGNFDSEYWVRSNLPSENLDPKMLARLRQDRIRYRAALCAMCLAVLQSSDLHLKRGGYSSLMIILLSDSRFLDHLMDHADGSEAGPTIFALVNLATTDPKIRLHIGCCAQRLNQAIAISPRKADFLLSAGVALKLLAYLWSGNLPRRTSMGLTSLILSLTPQSKSSVGLIWHQIADTASRTSFPTLEDHDSLRIFIRWAGLKLCQNFDPPIFTWAVDHNLDDVVEILVKEGVKHSRQGEICSPLYAAIRRSKPERVIKALIRCGAGSNGSDGTLHLAARSLNLVAVKLLLDAGYDPNGHIAEFGTNGTVLAWVCSKAEVRSKGDAVPLIRLLIGRGADPNLPSANFHQEKGTEMLPIFFALMNPSFLIDDFLEVSSADANVSMQEWICIDGNICRSPISYLETKCDTYDSLGTSSMSSAPCQWEASDEDIKARIQTLERYGIRRKYYALEGPQPPGAIGLPPALQLIEDQRIDQRKSIERECDIFYEPISEPERAFGCLTDECKHGWSRVVCKDHLESYLASKMEIEDGVVSDQILCWAPDCKIILDYHDIKRYANPTDFENYDAALLRQAIHRGKEFLECATVKCRGGGWVDSNHTATRFICTRCGDATCVDCDRLFKGHPSDGCPVVTARISAKHAADIEASERFIQENFCHGICGHRVERTSGCDHMHCKYCNRDFCYACEADYGVIWKEGRHHHKPTCKHWKPK